MNAIENIMSYAQDNERKLTSSHDFSRGIPSAFGITSERILDIAEA
jgi:hypothetical protein